MGLRYWIEAPVLQEANDVSRHVVFALTERHRHIVLDDVIQAMLAQPAKGLVLAVIRD